jgi:nitrile hydratase alpha subunit
VSDHHHDHDHEHDHGNGNGPHRHPPAPDIELSERAKRALAMHELLVEKGIIGPDDLRQSMDRSSRSPSDGAKVVAKAWTDPVFKERLLSDPLGAIGELGYEFPEYTGLSVLENTEEVHHLVVCTLCSCYPGALLGAPPDWYKSLPYRSRAVIEPRSVMAEFGFDPGEDVEVRVMDSTAELRYLVLPLRPDGTDGMTEEELAELVVRDSMIGVRAPLTSDHAPVAAGD